MKKKIFIEAICSTVENPAVSTDELCKICEWGAEEFKGIPFASTYDPGETGDYDPTRPADFLSALHAIFETYQTEGEKIDRCRNDSPSIYEDTLPGDEGLSTVISNKEFYKLYKENFFRDLAEQTKKIVSDDDFSPSTAFFKLAEYWNFYARPEFIPSIKGCIEYCLVCAADFPDSDEAWNRFKNGTYGADNEDK